MGSGVTGSAHSRKAARAALAVALLGLAGCLEPVPYLDLGGATPGRPKHGHCTPMSCTGCCVGKECLGGNLDDACGYDGRPCTACPQTHRCEAPGACYPLPVKDDDDPPEAPKELVCQELDGMMRCH